MKNINLLTLLKRNKIPALISSAILIAGLIAGAAVLIAVPRFTVDNVYQMTLEETSEERPEGDEFMLAPSLTVLRPEGVKFTDKAAKKLEFGFSSSDTSVASVDESGKVVCLKKGETDITVTWGKQRVILHLTVCIPIDDIYLKEDNFSMNVGETKTLETIVVPETGTAYTGAFYESLNPSSVSVTEDGNVTALKAGRAVVRMTAAGYTRYAHITVLSPLTSVSITGEDEVEIKRGETLQLAYSYLPEDTTDDTSGTFTVSDPEKASVDENGLLTPLRAGDVTVTLAVGSFTDQVLVHILAPLESVMMAASNLEIRSGDVLTIPVSFFPEDTTDDTTLTWSTSDESVVSVDADGNLTAHNAGTALITVTCGEFSSSCNITVVIPVTGVSVSETTLQLIKGETHQLSASVSPDNTTEEKYISWSSTDIKKAAVENGLVTAVSPGHADIIVSHDDFQAVCSVDVLSPMTGIRFEQESAVLTEGACASLSVIYLPEDTTDERTVNWSVSDTSVARAENGVIKAVAPGECTVTITHGSFAASCHLTVTPYIDVTSVTPNTSSMEFSGTGQTGKITVSVQPADATDAAVSFSSSNTSVATVSSDGTVTSVGAGSCQITVTAGTKSAAVSVTVKRAAENVVVMLDPGHDGSHTGASYYGVYEQEANLKVAQACKAYLESHYAGVTVLMTHYDLSCPVGGASLKDDLETRAQMAQNAGASVLVSLHFNVSAGHTASGCVAYISKQANVYSQSAALGNCILSRISASFGITNRGCETTNSTSYFDSYGNPMDYYAINRHSANRGIPGIIVEHCFMDNASDMKYLTSDSYLNQFGVCDAQGIAAYLGLQEK